MSTKYRPEEFVWWMQHRRRFDLIPKVKASEFSAEWLAWWRAIQPLWREGDIWPMTHSVLNDADWATLHHGGANGLFLVLMTLSWWGVEIPSQCD